MVMRAVIRGQEGSRAGNLDAVRSSDRDYLAPYGKRPIISMSVLFIMQVWKAHAF